MPYERGCSLSMRICNMNDQFAEAGIGLVCACDYVISVKGASLLDRGNE